MFSLGCLGGNSVRLPQLVLLADWRPRCLLSSRPWSFNAPPLPGCRSSLLGSGHAGHPEPRVNTGGVLWVPPRLCRVPLPMTPFRPSACMCSGPHSAIVLLACQPCTIVVGVGLLLRRLLALHLRRFFRIPLWPPLSGGGSSVPRGSNARQIKRRAFGAWCSPNESSSVEALRCRSVAF